MALTYSQKGELGSPAPEFELLSTNDVHHNLRDFRNCRILVLVFMCNHCPYVKAVRQRINRIAAEGAEHGVQVVGINSNDGERYPEDGFEMMKREVEEQKYVFPYLWDKEQTVARAYGAVCTPDIFVYQNLTQHKDELGFVLKYHGRIDDNWQDESKVTRHELRDAIGAILAGREPAREQRASMGCSIKWKEGVASSTGAPSENPAAPKSGPQGPMKFY